MAIPDPLPSETLPSTSPAGREGCGTTEPRLKKTINMAGIKAVLLVVPKLTVWLLRRMVGFFSLRKVVKISGDHWSLARKKDPWFTMTSSKGTSPVQCVIKSVSE